MKITIDVDAKTLLKDDAGQVEKLDLYSDQAFAAISDVWVKVGWNQKYVYTFSWLGRPIIQLPEDMVRMQEAIFAIKPDVIIETGVAHGGSLIFYASLFHAMGRGRVIGVDIEIRPHNRKAIETHPLSSYITLIEGSSTAVDVVAQVAKHVKPTDSVMVVLDSNHTRQHVLDELKAYAKFVSSGSYAVATDGVMMNVADVPRGTPGWETDNPTMAAADFLKVDSSFELKPPPMPFNESTLTSTPTHWPGAWLRKK